MSKIIEKQNELRDLIIGKSLEDQKKIIVDFFRENRKISKHFRTFYKATKDIFENNTLNDYTLQEFINKTFISPEEMFVYSTYTEIHTGDNWDTDDSEFDVFKFDPTDPDGLTKNKKNG